MARLMVSLALLVACAAGGCSVNGEFRTDLTPKTLDWQASLHLKVTAIGPSLQPPGAP